MTIQAGVPIAATRLLLGAALPKGPQAGVVPTEAARRQSR